MKKYCNQSKAKILAFLIVLMLCVSCFTGLVKYDDIFADAISDLTTLNSMSVDEIARQERYNSCDYDIVTPNLDQGSTQICWAYATASASETSVLKDRLDNNTKDTLRFSPQQIAYRMHNRDKDPLNNTDGVYANDKWNVTGSSDNTFLILSQWCAPVAGGVAHNANAYENNLYRLLDAEKMDLYNTGTHRINEIKRAIAKYGAVTGSYYNAREVEYYNTLGETRDGISHAMTIVGWDDTISANKFQPKTASQNGGWIIKNSYNTLPYFYLSYDSSIGNICGFKYANKSEFDFNYFYDNVLESPMRSETNSKCVANVFVAKKGDDKHNEYVKAINVGTYGYNLTCKVQVYTNLTDPKNPESGTLSATGERVLEYGGYHTIMLDKLAKIDKDSYYSVVVSISSHNGGSAYILYSLNSSNNTHYKFSGDWNSYVYAGRIKAYTVLQEIQEVEQKIDIASANHSNIDALSFTGQPLCPLVEVSLNSQTLISNIDYTISYRHNTNVGIAEITITGIGKYTGSFDLQFEILPIDTPTRPNKEIKYSSEAITLADISLPSGWQWETPNLSLVNLTSATAIYVDENKENYKETTMIITLKKEVTPNPSPDTPGDDNSTNDSPNENDNHQDGRLSHNTKVYLTIILTSVGIIAIPLVVIILKIKHKRK